MDSIHIHQMLVERVTRQTLADFNQIREAVGVPSKTWAQFENEKWDSWLIQKAGQPIGIINIVPFTDEEQEIGFVLVPEERRNGILGALLGPFAEALRTPLYSETAEDNLPAKRVLEKAGFKRCDAVHKTHVDPSGKEGLTAAYRFLPCD